MVLYVILMSKIAKLETFSLKSHGDAVNDVLVYSIFIISQWVLIVPTDLSDLFALIGQQACLVVIF